MRSGHFVHPYCAGYFVHPFCAPISCTHFVHAILCSPFAFCARTACARVRSENTYIFFTRILCTTSCTHFFVHSFCAPNPCATFVHGLNAVLNLRTFFCVHFLYTILVHYKCTKNVREFNTACKLRTKDAHGFGAQKLCTKKCVQELVRCKGLK